jgi:cytochrome c-type biogenesis protein CcmH/NrfG
VKFETEYRAMLESERSFLLRSLEDLDSELMAGNIDPDSYRTLHDDYTARAAEVIRELEEGTEPEKPEKPRGLKWITYGGIAIFVGLVAFLMSQAVGDRQPGQSATGNDDIPATVTTVARDPELEAAENAVDANPNDYDARVRYARALVATRVDGGPKYADAIQQYVEASKIDPDQAEPYAYSGWISAIVASATSDAPSRQTLLEVAGKRLDQAIAVDPDYTDSYVFKGLVLARYENKPCDSVAPFQQFLTKAPQDHPMREDVLAALSQAVAAGKCETTSTVSP